MHKVLHYFANNLLFEICLLRPYMIPPTGVKRPKELNQHYGLISVISLFYILNKSSYITFRNIADGCGVRDISYRSLVPSTMFLFYMISVKKQKVPRRKKKRNIISVRKVGLQGIQFQLIYGNPMLYHISQPSYGGA